MVVAAGMWLQAAVADRFWDWKQFLVHQHRLRGLLCQVGHDRKHVVVVAIVAAAGYCTLEGLLDDKNVYHLEDCTQDER